MWRLPKEPQLERLPGIFLAIKSWDSRLVKFQHFFICSSGSSDFFVILILILQAVGDSALATFAQHCNNIERLNLRNCKKLSDRTCQYLARHCSKLQVKRHQYHYCVICALIIP